MESVPSLARAVPSRSLRAAEFGLTLLGWGVVFTGMVSLTWATRRELLGPEVWPLLVLVGGYLVTYLFLVARRWQGDQYLLPLVNILSGLGLIQVSRLSPSLVEKQTIWLVLSFFLLLLTLAAPWPNLALKRYKYTAALLGLGMVAVSLVFGTDPNGSGARLWISYGGISFQLSEVTKVLLVIFLAAYLDDKRELLSLGSYRFWRFNLPPLPYLGPLLAMWGLSVVVLVVERDLGPVMLLFGVFLAMLYIASSRMLYVWTGVGLFLAAAFAGYQVLSVVQRRVDIWLNPWADPQNTSFQLVQSLVAIASGGVLGAGLGHGYPNLIPAAWTDFPFAALTEELGILGGLAILGLYALLTFRGFLVSLRAPTTFEQLLGAGLTTTLGLQALIIIGGNIRLIPLTGITLPFISYGGSSLLTNFVLIGLLLRVANHSERTRGLEG